MFGILIYVFFLALGYAYSHILFKNKDLYFRIWMGGVFGNVILMMGIVLPSLFLGFTHLSHFVLILLSPIPLIYTAKKKGTKEIMAISEIENVSGINLTVLLSVILPVVLLISVLLTNHILVPFANGGVASGQSTFGDLQMHLGYVTSIAEQQKFPPEYAFLSGHKLSYPFFVNMLSSSLYLFGTSLRLSVLIPSYVISALLVMGFYTIAYKITNRKSAAILSVVFFFLGGGFGFSYFLNGAKANPNIFTDIFTGYYHTPTNYNDYNLRWSNPICDMIIPQRTTMAGWCMLFPTLWLLLEGLKTKERKTCIILAVLAGCMPMIHTHSFLALGMISAVLFFAYLVGEENKKSYIINWIWYGAIVFVMAAPQLIYWTFSQSVNNDSFLRYSFNWVNKNDPYFWFYLKNWGIIALFALPAILNASKDNKKLLLACGFIFCVAEFILFQPNEYDNNKLFFIVYMILLINVCDWLLHMWDVLKGIKGRVYIAAIVIITSTLSGTLTIVREYESGGKYQTFSDDDITMAEYIKNNTPSDALFLTSTAHLNPVVTLAGRNIYAGSSLYVFFHGLGNEFYRRESEINAAYVGSYDDLVSFCNQKGIDYVYIGDNERRNHPPSPEIINRLELVYSSGSEALYRIK